MIESALETVEVASTDRQVVYHTRDHIEAPNWSRDGKFFLFNSKGRIYQLPVKGGTPELLDTGSQTQCNNDHGISPDGKRLAISDQTKGRQIAHLCAADFRRQTASDHESRALVLAWLVA